MLEQLIECVFTCMPVPDTAERYVAKVPFYTSAEVPVIADAHYIAGTGNELLLDSAIEQIRERKRSYPFILIAGDLIDRDVDDLENTFRFLARRIAAASPNAYMVLGNHEIGACAKRGVNPVSFLKRCVADIEGFTILSDECVVDFESGIPILGLAENSNNSRIMYDFEEVGEHSEQSILLAHGGSQAYLRDLALFQGYKAFPEGAVVVGGHQHKGWLRGDATCGFKESLRAPFFIYSSLREGNYDDVLRTLNGGKQLNLAIDPLLRPTYGMYVTKDNEVWDEESALVSMDELFDWGKRMFSLQQARTYLPEVLKEQDVDEGRIYSEDVLAMLAEETGRNMERFSMVLCPNAGIYGPLGGLKHILGRVGEKTGPIGWTELNLG